MNRSRRTFLQKSAFAAASLSLNNWKHETDPVGITKPRGLLFEKADIPRILESTKHPHFAPYWKSVVDANLDADTKFLREELRLNNHVADILRARLILEKTSFAYALTEDTKQRDLALLAIGRILEYPKWDYFQEGGTETIGLQRAPETTIAMSCALDWLGNALDEQTRSAMLTQIAEKGAPPCFRTLWGMLHPDRVRGWGFDPDDDYKFRFDLSRWPIILNSTNLKVIPIAGLGLAGCLLRNRHSQADRWTDLALQSARAFAPMFGTDGSYEEGVSYWGYTALHLALFLEVLWRTRGVDERGLINFPGTVRYGLQMSMPTVGKPADCVNFSDASTVGDTAVAAWVARNTRDGIAQYVATEVGEVKNNFGMIWFDRTVPVKTPGRDLYDVRFANDWVVSRTGWDVNSNVVALRSGLPANHEHADRNSIIFKAYGERLFHDPFKAAYSYTIPHWILRLTESHTSVLIGGKGHQYHTGKEGTNASWAEARVVDYSANDSRMVVTSDATDAYKLVNPQVDRVQRTVVFLKPDILILLDRVKLQSPDRVQVRFQIYNEDGNGKGQVKEDGFTIERPGAVLQAVTRSRNDLVMRADRLKVPEDVGIFPYVEVEAEPAVDHEILTLCFAHKDKTEASGGSVERRDKDWMVKGSHKGKSFEVTISAAADIPLVHVATEKDPAGDKKR